MNIKMEIKKCLDIYEHFKQKDNANDLFRVFYDIESRLKRIMEELERS